MLVQISRASLAVATLIGVVLYTALVARAQSGSISGELPTGGGVALVVWGGGSFDDLAAEASASGCAVVSAWATIDGEFVGNINGAPDFVNADWNSVFDTTIPADTPLVVLCESAPLAGPPPAATAVPTATVTPTVTPMPTAAPTLVPTGPAGGVADRDCVDFGTWTEAQAFFLEQGGPESDPHALDANGDGIACEGLPGAP